MGHRAIAIVVRGRTAEAYRDHWAGARLLDDVLSAGPRGCTAATRDLEPVGKLAAAHWWEAGVLVDLTRKRVLWFADPTTGYVWDAPGEAASDASAWEERIARVWPRFSIEPVDDVDELVAYLTNNRIERDVPLEDEDFPPLPEVDDGGEERQEMLRAREADCLAAPEVGAKQKEGFGAVGCALLLVLPAALVARLLLLPVRASAKRAIRRRDAARRAAYRRASREAITRFSDRLAASPDDHEARIDRAVLLPHAAGERELDDCVARLETEPEGDERTRLLRFALHNRGVKRTRLGFPNLGRTDIARARSIGFVAKPSQSVARRFLAFLVGMFLVFAGLATED